MRCGDCGDPTALEGLHRVCRTCGTRTLQLPKGRRGPPPQNIPIRTPEGRRVREAWTAMPSFTADYAGLEERALEGATRQARRAQRESVCACGRSPGECEC